MCKLEDRQIQVFGHFDWVGRLRCPFLRDEMQPRAVRFPHLFCRDYFATKIGKSNKLLLDGLQPFVPLSVSDLSICSMPAVAPKLFI